MKRPKFTGVKFIRVSSLAAIAWGLILQASLATAGHVDPASVTDALAPSQNIVINKTVQTPDIPPRPDIVFLADTTGSMTDALANVQANAAVNAVTAAFSRTARERIPGDSRDGASTGDNRPKGGFCDRQSLIVNSRLGTRNIDVRVGLIGRSQRIRQRVGACLSNADNTTGNTKTGNLCHGRFYESAQQDTLAQ